MFFESSRQILSVDDDEATEEMLRVLFSLHGIVVKSVANGSEALRQIALRKFDLYLLDARLRGMDGFDLCRRIRASDATTPIVFCSGAASDADIQRGLSAGADAYVVKPDIEGLVKEIERLLCRPRWLGMSSSSLAAAKLQQLGSST